MQITIETNLIKAIFLAVPKNDIRFYLNGLFIDHRGFIVGTDGHRIHVGKLEEPTGLEKDIIIPRDVIEKALKGHKQPTCILDVTEDRMMLNNIVFEPIDGHYPNWTRVCGENQGKASINSNGYVVVDVDKQNSWIYDPVYMMDVKKALGFLGYKVNAPVPCSDFKNHFSCDDASANFFAVIMPVKMLKASTSASPIINWIP